MEKFLFHKWIQKALKAIIAVVLAALLGPQVQPVLAGLGLTVEVDPAQLQAGLTVVLLSAANALKHQKWMPELVKRVL